MIRYIKMKNLLSNNKEITIDFNSKFNEKSQDSFFDYSLKAKKRSKYKEGTLKTIGIIGKNAAYKTSTLVAINKVLDFLVNFENNIRDYAFSKLSVSEAMRWYQEEKKKDPYDMSINKILEAYWKKLNKNQTIFEMKDQYIEHFYNQNCFNKTKQIFFEVQFDKKDLNLKVNIKKEASKFVYSIKLNNLDYNIVKLKKLDWFNHNFIQLNVLARKHDCNCPDHKHIFLHRALTYLFVQKFKKSETKLLLFLQKLDPSVIDIKIKVSHGSMKITKVTREYNDFYQDIEIDKLSTGTKLFINCLYLILKSDFIMIDEIENSLHLKMIELLLSIAKHNNKQVLFSTHNPTLLDFSLEKFQMLIFEIANEKLEIKRASRLFREKESINKKYLLDLVSSPSDSDLDYLEKEFF